MFFPGPKSRKNLRTCRKTTGCQLTCAISGACLKQNQLLNNKKKNNMQHFYFFIDVLHRSEKLKEIRVTLPGLNSGKSSVTSGSDLAASFCMMPARGRFSWSGGPPDPNPWQGRSVSDSESEELLKSTLSAREDGAIIEGRMMPSPSSESIGTYRGKSG